MSNSQIDGGATRLTNVVIGNQRRSEGFLKFLESEKAAEDAKNAAAVAPIQATLRAITAQERAFWGKPLAELKQWNKARFESLTPDLNVPTFPDEVMEGYKDQEKAIAAAKQVKAEFDAFIKALTPHTGWVLSQDAQARFRLFVTCQVAFRSAVVNHDTLGVMLNWLSSCFPESEVGYDESLITVQRESAPTTPPTFDEVLRTTDSTQGREAERHLRDAAETAAEEEYRSLVTEFLNHLRTVWHFEPDNESWKYLFNPIHGLFVRMNWSLLDPRNFDAARRAMAKSGRWPVSMLTAGEQIDLDYQTQKMTWPEYNVALQSLTRRGLVNRPKSEAGL